MILEEILEPPRLEFEPPRLNVLKEAPRKNKENDSFMGKMNFLISMLNDNQRI